MKRALLLFNPEATMVSRSVRDVIAHALSSELKLEIAETKRRHHATHIARGAAHEGFDVVVCLGGDGTLNEVANGMAGMTAALVPLPGGGTNVFARSMGLPNDPIEATSVVLERIADGTEPRRINLGKVNDRIFLCNVGIGFDAAVVHAVERRMRIRKHVGDPYYVFQGLRTFFFAYPRREPSLALDAGSGPTSGFYQVVACNSNPYTYLGNMPLQLCPMAAQERGLDVTAFSSFRTVTVLRVLARAFGSGGHTKFRSVRALHDLDAFVVTSTTPAFYQVDGDLAGEDTRFSFESVPDALSVLV
jgi:diacylglycerol kinase family enzyme